MAISLAVSETVSGPDLGRDVLEFNALPAALDLDVAPVLHQRQIVRHKSSPTRSCSAANATRESTSEQPHQTDDRDEHASATGSDT